MPTTPTDNVNRTRGHEVYGIPDALWRQFRIAAAERGMTASALFIACLSYGLDHLEQALRAQKGAT